MLILRFLGGNFLHGVFQSRFHFLKSELYLCKREISYLQRRCLSYRTSQCRPEERQDWRRDGGSSSDHEINPPAQVGLLSRKKKKKGSETYSLASISSIAKWVEHRPSIRIKLGNLQST